MNYIDTIIAVSIALFLLVVVSVVSVAAVRMAYLSGVRDGYQNTFLPKVREQVQQEGLSQGEEIPLP